MARTDTTETGTATAASWVVLELLRALVAAGVAVLVTLVAGLAVVLLGAESGDEGLLLFALLAVGLYALDRYRGRDLWVLGLFVAAIEWCRGVLDTDRER